MTLPRLTLMFSNNEYRFTPPAYTHASLPLFPTDRTWSFAELYLDCLANSSKAHKSLKEKMAESQEYAVDFAKIGLLINLGRLNTTHAMTLESKQAMRSFHPMPAFQVHEYTRRNLIDTARLKAQLKACQLPQEGTPPDTLARIAAVAVSCPGLCSSLLMFEQQTGKRPTTTAANAFFVISTQANVS
jgi:hypothetical protein